MITSILTSVKKYLNIAEADESFDEDILMHINSAFANLNSLGIGPASGFEITDDTAEWSSYLGTDKNLNSVKSYVYLNVKKAFDPPGTSFHLNAIDDQIAQFAFRLNVERENNIWGSAKYDPGTLLQIQAGLPFNQVARIVDGKTLWATLDLFDVTLIVREAYDRGSLLLVDLSRFVTATYDANDIVLTWSMTGADTRTLTSGYYDMVVSDVGDTDVQAIQVLCGWFRVTPTALSFGSDYAE